MKKKYLIPSLERIIISETEMIAGGTSMKIGGSDEKVDNPENIGFVKDNGSHDYNVWDDDWSAEQ